MNPKFVASLDLCKKLKELRVKQESDFYWYLNPNMVDMGKPGGEVWQLISDQQVRRCPYSRGEYCSAFSVGELGEILPSYVDCIYEILHKRGIHGEFDIHLRKFEGIGWIAGDTTEANARAKMLIYLLENKLMEVK